MRKAGGPAVVGALFENPANRGRIGRNNTKGGIEMEIRLPEDSGIDVNRLACLFQNMNQSYKMFWFKAIVEKVREGKYRLSYDELVNAMIVDAWYMVLEYHLNLGAGNTKLLEVVSYAGETSGLKPSEKKEKVLDFLRNSEDKRILKGKKELISNVPYRLLSPFVQEMDKEIWKYGEKKIAEILNGHSQLMYYFIDVNSLYSQIEMQPSWIAYIQKNGEIILGWIYYNLVTYLQKRNPNVPGIPNKLYPPQTRQNLEKAKKYWKAVAAAVPIRDIYANSILDPREIVMDHFVPWSYLTHDELWNLNPTRKEVNSRKSNYLPDWKMYIDALCQLEYQAYQLGSQNDTVRKLFHECKKAHINDDRIREQLYYPGKTKERFFTELKEILYPVYESARRSGFQAGWMWQE